MERNSTIPIIVFQEEVPLSKIEVPDSLLELVDEPAEISWFENLKLLIGGYKMDNWKTTLTGFLGLVTTIVAHFGFNVPNEVSLGIVAITGFVVSIFSHDAKPVPVETE